MKIFLSILLIFLTGTLFAQSLDGYYEGMERMSWVNEKGKTEYYDSPRKWFHFNHLTIKNDSVYLYRCPVILKKRDTLHSASDGAFYYHYGLLLKTDSGYFVSYYKRECDYCSHKKKKNPVTGKLLPENTQEIYKITVGDKGLEINGVKYGRKLMSLMN